MTQSIVRYLIVSLLAYLVGHGVITQDIASQDTAICIKYAIIGLSLFGTIVWSYLEKKYKGVLSAYFPNTVGRTSPPASLIILLALAGGGCVLLTGCATSSGTLPAQFQNLTPPLSATDTKIVDGLMNFDSPAALLGIETGSATITSVTMYASIKSTATMDSDGLLLNGGGQELEAFTSGSVGSTSAVDDIFTGLKESASTTQSATNFAAIATALDGVLATGKAYITNAATSATNPSVAAYALTVFCDDVHAVGKGVCDATSQYASVTTLKLRLPVSQRLYALSL
jgi:hypothetical protein